MIPPPMFPRFNLKKYLLQVAGPLTLITLVAGPVQAQGLARPATDSSTVPSARGVIRPWHEVKIAADLSAKVKHLPLRVGDSFSKGAVLIEFDCARFEADLRAVRASEAEFTAVHRTNLTLRQHRAAGANEVEISKARLAKASAEAESLALRIGHCRIEAPFGGRVAERMVDMHELPQANQPLLRIVNDGELEVALIVPASWLRWLKADMQMDFTLDDTGAKAVASVTRLGAAVDPVSQTVEVFARLKGATGHVLPGMSGTARFAVPQG
ncbi:MAG: efflux RND transporter periplasmic adaptor subunit [Beijerinckiaceae bacterium]